MVQLIKQLVLCSYKFGFTLLPCLVIDLKLVIKGLKSTKSYVIQLKVAHHSDGALPNSLNSWTHFLYCFLDIGRLYAFAKMLDPQGKCMLLHKIGIYQPKVTQ